MRNVARLLRRDRRGVAAVEFALWSTLIFGALLPCLDFATYLLESERLSGAVGQASILAYNMRAGPIDTDQLSQYVAASSGSNPGVTAAVTCNGGTQSCATATSMRTCACIGSGATITFVPTGVCGASCGSGVTSGFYLTVSGTRSYHAILPNRWLDGRTITSRTTVRLQ